METEATTELPDCEPLLLTTKQVVKRTSWSKATIQRLANEGALTAIRPPGHKRAVRFLRDEVEALIDTCAEHARRRAPVSTAAKPVAAAAPRRRRTAERRRTPQPKSAGSTAGSRRPSWRDFLAESAKERDAA